MFGTEFLMGQGLGNQLFCYVTAKCIAEDLGYEFGCAGKEIFAQNIHNDRGMYFMDIDLGGEFTGCSATKYCENEVRMITKKSYHDATNGCLVSGMDPKVYEQSDDTILYGNLQDESYFKIHKNEICQWLKFKPEYEIWDWSDENTCIMNMRGGEYRGLEELYLKKDYWENAMKYMQSINSDMRFIIITEDIDAAKTMFPDLPAFHYDIAGDFSVIKNAYYLILSNSSFAFFPVFTSKTVKFLIAPKYWARHNVSDGYWASGQNIYTGWNYMDREGKVYSAEECREELNNYWQKNKKKLERSKSKIWKWYCRTCVRIHNRVAGIKGVVRRVGE